MTKLPGNSIGPSDLISYRECPQRFAFSMRRHIEMPERFRLEPGEKADPDERQSYAASYGSAAHDCIEMVERTGCSDEEAIDAVWPRYDAWLEPADADRLRDDLTTYRTRTATGYRLIGAELELKTPLFEHEGEMIYLRGRVDVLYQSLQNPAVFLSRDYKSSRWPKSEAEVHADIQAWTYNLLIHESYPECGKLIQHYDQLRFGSIPTTKSDVQRRQIREWLIREVKKLLADRVFKPKANKWCHSCALAMDCRVTHLASDWWINRLGALAPERKDGNKIVVQLTKEIAGIEQYVEMLPKAKLALKVIERFVAAVERLLKDLPQDRREELGYGLAKPRELDVFSPDALRRIQALKGDDFYHLVTITKAAVNGLYGEGSADAAEILALAEKKLSAPSLKAPKS